MNDDMNWIFRLIDQIDTRVDVVQGYRLTGAAVLRHELVSAGVAMAEQIVRHGAWAEDTAAASLHILPAAAAWRSRPHPPASSS